MYQLLARMYGNNNLPDSSNMCHESTSITLPETIGVSVGTVKLEDFRITDCIFFLGQNVGVNSPRMLHQLQAARERGVPIITFNPLRERGLERFTNPQSPLEMLALTETQISTQYHQLNPGGDLAALVGMSKALLDMDDAGKNNGGGRALDVDFINQQTSGFEEFVTAMNLFQWGDIEACNGTDAGSNYGGDRGLQEFECRNRLLWHGPDAASLRRPRHSDVEQPSALARQYRQTRRRNYAGTWPLERARSTHRRHHRETGIGATRSTS